MERAGKAQNSAGVRGVCQSYSGPWAPRDDGILELGQPWLITSGSSLQKEENVSILRFYLQNLSRV